jgi:hypothetical protein
MLVTIKYHDTTQDAKDAVGKVAKTKTLVLSTTDDPNTQTITVVDAQEAKSLTNDLKHIHGITIATT